VKEQGDLYDFVGYRENVQVLVELLHHGADVTLRDGTHSTPLHLALSNGDFSILELLIEHGADVNARNRSRSTPLHLASRLAVSSLVSVNIMRLLLRQRADMREKKYNTYRDRIANNVRVLLEHGADVTARDDTYSTPLHLASSSDSPETVELLIGHGASVNAQDGNHNTPLFLALSSWQLKTMWLLIENRVNDNMGDRSHPMSLHPESPRRSPNIELLSRHLESVNSLHLNSPSGVSVKFG
jgi:ankyrin repeat protein